MVTVSALAKQRHPLGLWLLSAVYAFFTLSFGGLNSLLVLYITNDLHQSQHFAYGIFGGFNAVIWTLPILGGYLATKLGYRIVTVVGLLLCIIGAFVLSVNQLSLLYVALGIYAIGYGLATPACFSMVGFLYAKDDHRRESAYTLFYLLFNFGFLLSVALSGYIATYVSYHVAFIAIGLAMSASTIVFISCVRLIKPYPGRSFHGTVPYKKSVIPFILAIAFGTTFSALLLEHITVTNWIMVASVVGSIILILAMALKQRERLARTKLIAFIMLAILSLAFWTLYSAEPSLLTLFIEHNVDRNFAGTVIPASSYYSLDSLYVIIFGVALSWLWHYLARHRKDLALPTKFVGSIIIVGMGFLVFYLATKMANPVTHLTNQAWIVIAYAFLAFAELLIAPIGMSMVGRLSPAGHEGLLMGIWTLFLGFSAIISEFVGDWAAIDSHVSLQASNLIYAKVFLTCGSIAVAVGLLAALLIPKLKQLIN